MPCSSTGYPLSGASSARSADDPCLNLGHTATVRVGPRFRSENGITFAVGKCLPARGKLTRSGPLQCSKPMEVYPVNIVSRNQSHRRSRYSPIRLRLECRQVLARNWLMRSTSCLGL